MTYNRDFVFQADRYLKVYNNILTANRSALESHFIEKKLCLHKKDIILDCPCWSWRISSLLSLKGYTVIGLDNNNGLLEVAIWKDKRTEYMLGDMREIPETLSITKSYCIFSSFGYFTDEENLNFLRSISKITQPNGLFLLELINPYMAYSFDGFVSKLDVGENEIYVEEKKYIPSRDTIETKVTLCSEWVIVNYTYWIKVYNYTTIEKMLFSVWFEVISTYWNYDETPFSVKSKRLIIICKKLSD